MEVRKSELPARRLALEQRNRLVEEGARTPRLAAIAQGRNEVDHHLTGPQDVLLPARVGDRLLVAPLRLKQASGQPGGLRRLRDDLGPVGMTLGQELESAPVVPLGLGDVELDSPVAGQDEEAASGRLEPLALVQGASCARELERLAVVVGE